MRIAQRQQEAIDLVYERMFKKFVKELFKSNQDEKNLSNNERDFGSNGAILQHKE